MEAGMASLFSLSIAGLTYTYSEYLRSTESVYLGAAIRRTKCPKNMTSDRCCTQPVHVAPACWERVLLGRNLAVGCAQGRPSMEVVVVTRKGHLRFLVLYELRALV